MKKKIKKYTILLFLILLFLWSLIKSNIVMENAIFALDLWKTKVFPSLFPIFILIDVLINYDLISILNHFLYKPFYKLFRFNKEELYIFFLSMLGGFPSSSKYTAKFYKEKRITLDNANRMLMCSHYSNPIFIFGTILSMFPYKKLCLLIFLSHYLGNFILAFYTREHQQYQSYKRKEKETLSFSDCITNSITSNTQTLLFILGSITIFYILSAFLSEGLKNYEVLSGVLSGLLEITQGITKITTIYNLPLHIKAALITFFLSFGGLCVHIQTLGMIQNTKISYWKFLKGRIIHSTLSVILYIILSHINL